MRSGKNYAGDYLKEQYPDLDFKLMALADPIKEMAMVEFGVTKDNHPNSRKILQFIGTELGRNLVNQDIWVKKTLERIMPDENVIITDVRFPNEVRGLQEAGFKVVRLDVFYSTQLKRGKVENPNHPSETALNPDEFPHNTFDWTIKNNSTKEAFNKELDIMLGYFKTVVT